MFICAGESESFDFARAIGIGMVQSAMNLTKICLEEKPKNLIFIGTAGSYGRLKIGEIVRSASSSNIEIGYFDELSYTPLKNNIVSRETSTDLIVNSSNFITCDEKISMRMLNNGYDLENMEFFAVQSVANNFHIPFYGIFYITNYGNEDAHEDFIKNHKTAIKELSLHVKKMNL